MGWGQSIGKDALTSLIEKGHSESNFSLLRTLSFSGAGVALLILGLTPRVTASTGATFYSLVLASFAIPLWACLGFVHEYYIFIGKTSYSHYKLGRTKILIGALFLISGGSLFFSLFFFLFTLSPVAAYVYLASALISAIALFVFHVGLSKHLTSQN
jgi:hypothetical protein